MKYRRAVFQLYTVKWLKQRGKDIEADSKLRRLILEIVKETDSGKK